jgi:predicted acylesterase/phospholipase RssA
MSAFEHICLSGGAQYSIMTLGCLCYFQLQGLDFSKIITLCGTSSGAIICALLAIGYMPDDIINYLCRHNVGKDMNFNLFSLFRNASVCDYEGINKHLETLFIHRIGYVPTLGEVFKIFGKTLIITTYNQTKKTVEYLTHHNFPDLSVTIALRMSCNLPFVFDKYLFMGDYYVDGGVIDNFPIKKMLEYAGECDRSKVLGIFIDTVPQTPDKMDLLEYFYNTVAIPINHISNADREECKERFTCLVLYRKSNNMHFDLNKHNVMELCTEGFGYAQNFS